MKVFSTLYRFFSSYLKRSKRWGGATLEAPVEKVFTVNGIDYYKFCDEAKIPAKRALVYLDFQKQLSEGIDKKYLTTYFKSIIAACNKGDLVEVARLSMLAQQRHENISILRSWYDVASILYFDENENPNDYDFEYNEKKIHEWMKHDTVLAFFLKTQLKNFITSLNLSEEDLQMYLTGELVQLKQIFQHRLSQLYDAADSIGEKSKLQSQINILEELICLRGKA